MQSHLAKKGRGKAGPATPFEQTSRYARGRIIAVLRNVDERGVSANQIADSLIDGTTSLSLATIEQHLGNLVREGLVELVPISEKLVAEDRPAYDGHENGSRQMYRLPK
jgi:hypothetical protein